MWLYRQARQFNEIASLAQLPATSVFINTNPTDEPITSGLPVTRSE
jgi:hypothetical protein